MPLSPLGWTGLFSLLCVATFGVWNCFVIICCIVLFLGSAILVLNFRNVKTCQEYWNVVFTSRLPFPSSGIKRISELVRMPIKPSKYDRRLTGASIIDEPLQEVLQLTLKDYIDTWYRDVSTEDTFLNDLRETAQNVIIAFSKRAKDVHWVPYLTTRLVDDFASHLRLFRQAQMKIQEKQKEDPKTEMELISVFFDLETEMEKNLCRDCVSTSAQSEKEYLQDLSEVLLFLLLPPGDFYNKPLRFLARELLVNGIFLPTIEQFSDPDYINQIIVWLCKEETLTSEGFLTIIRMTDNVDELEAIYEKVHQEISLQRSKDSGGEDDTEIKQQLSSLFFVQKIVNNRLKRLQSGSEDTFSELPCSVDWNKLVVPGQKLFCLPLDVVLKNNVALAYFIDFMTSINCQNYIYFYLNIEGFRVSAEQQLSELHLNKISNPNAEPVDLEPLREAALTIYDQYLSEKAVPRVKLDDQLIRRLLGRLRTETPTEAWFDEIQLKIYELFHEEKFFPAFKKSDYYIKLLAELELLSVNKSDEEDGQSVEDMPLTSSSYDSASLSSLEETSSESSFQISSNTSSSKTASISTLPPDAIISARIVDLVIKDTGRSYAVYTIDVIKTTLDSEDRWQVYRRYSDFHDFHMSLICRFGNNFVQNFPGKKAFNNMKHQFLEKRMKLLNDYLQKLLKPDVLKFNPGLLDYVYRFLEPVNYERSKGQFARKVVGFKNSMRNISHAMRSVPDNLIHSVDGVMDGISKVLSNRTQGNLKSSLNDSSKVAAGLDIEGDDNIPLRIILLLMDEIFDLKSRNQWLRRRIVTILRQIIKTTFGDRINRKIIDSVAWWTSSEQVSEYVKAFKQAFWPNGSLALPTPPRDNQTKMRTRVAAKTAILCSVSDELKHIIGSETTRKGILLLFEMAQQKTLNKRFVYVLMEGIFETLFPNNKFPEIFRKLHSRSTRVKPNIEEYRGGSGILSSNF